MKHLLSRIEKMMPGFSKGQRRIAQYIEDHYDKAAFMTASKLGAASEGDAGNDSEQADFSAAD